MKTINAAALSLIFIIAASCSNTTTGKGSSSEPLFLSLLLSGSSGTGSIRVASMVPANSSTSIAYDTTVTAVFNDEVKCSTVTTQTFTLADGTAPVAGTVYCTGLTAIFTPSTALSANTQYTATLAGTVENLKGEVMGETQSWTFTTEPGGPSVSATTPSAGATGVSRNAVITATFSEEVKCSTVTSSSFTLSDGAATVAGTVACTGLTAIFMPGTSLAAGSSYTATITTAVQNLAGNPIAADHAWTFTTGSAPTLEQKMRGLWIIGGTADLTGTSVIPEIDMYDPMTDTWYPDVAAGASGTYVPTAFNSAASMNGKIYVMGGAVNSGAATFAVVEYDIAANTWTTRTNIQNSGVNTALMASTAYTYANNIYLMGGSTTTTTAGVAAYHLRYNPAAGAYGTWYNTPPAAYTTARSGMGSACIGGITYYFGGRIAAGTGVTTNTAYTIATNAYSAALTAITARGGMAYASNSGTNGTYVFIVGGATAFSVATAYFSANPTYVAQANSFQIFTPGGGGAGTVTNGRYHPAFDGGTTTGIVHAGAAVSPYNGINAGDPTLYVFGGLQNQSIVTNEVWSITANDTLGGYPTATWYAKTAMPRPRFGHSVVAAEQ
ncbi:MAG: Ig-like domain-containing protein [Spirochaetes bacterium]|nr:Ig-like domain-containing protein [Spirochaetota bacterium]